MRTTVTLDSAVYSQLKVAAASAGASVSSVIEEAVRAYLLEQQASPARPAPALPTMRSGGTRPGIDLDDMSAVNEALDEGRAVDAVR